MDKLKALFGTEALTFEQLEEKLKDNKEIKLANLVAGGYVDKRKYDDVVVERDTANNTIKGLKDTVAKFDGVDIEKLKKDAYDWETKYNTDIAAVKLDSDIYKEVMKYKPKNPELVIASLDKSIIKRDGDKIIGLTEQLDKRKESDGYLFEAETKGDPEDGAHLFNFNTGGNHGNAGNADVFLSGLMKGAGLDENK